MPKSSLELYIPKQQITRSAIINCSPKAIKQELKELPLANMPAALRQTCALLSLINRTKFSDSARLGIMQCFDNTFRNINDYYHSKSQQYIQQITPTEQHKLSELKEEMAFGYKIILQEAISRDDMNHKPMADIVYMAMFYLCQCLMQHYDTFTQPGLYLWKEVNHLFKFAEDHKFYRIAVKRQFQPIAGENVEELYKQIMLVEMANPYHLAPGEAWFLYSYLGKHANYARMTDSSEQSDPSQYFSINLNSEQRPHNAFSHSQRSEDPIRYLFPEKLVALLDQHVSTLAGGHRPAEIGIPTATKTQQVIELLCNVKEVWRQSRHRLGLRIPCNSFTAIVWGVDTIHQLLSPEKQKEVLQDSQLHRTTGRMVNESENGFCLKLTHVNYSDFHNGQVIAMRSDKQSHPRWILGIIRWQQQDAEAQESLVGVEYIRGLVRPITLKTLTEKSKTQRTTDGLLVTNKVNGRQQHSVLVSAGVYIPGKGLQLEVPQQGKEYDIQADDLLQHTSCVDRFSFKAYVA